MRFPKAISPASLIASTHYQVVVGIGSTLFEDGSNLPVSGLNGG
jgi:hypothetical protein